MKFVISTQELNYLISRCLGAVGQKGAIPILNNILLEAKNGELRMSATDLNMGISCYTEAKILEEGATTLPSRKLNELVRALTAVNIEVRSNEKHITEIIADSSRFKLNGMAATEFPALPSFEQATPVKIDQALLFEMLQGTAFAVARDESRFELTGVQLRIADKKGCFIGTDGKRLARAFFPIDLDASFTGSYIIPIKAVEEILKNISGEEAVTLYLQQDKIALETESAKIVCKLISGDYPDIDRVIPEKIEKVFSIHRQELMTLLKQVSLFSGSEYQSVTFTFKKGELCLDANATEVGEGNVSMPVDYHGETFQIAFNPHYVLDVLKRRTTETVVFGLNDAFNPGIVSDEGSLQTFATPLELNPLYVIMPLRLPG